MVKVIDMTKRQAKQGERRDGGRLYGDILIARRIFESAAFKGRRHAEMFLWIHLLIRARFKDGRQLKRGQVFTNVKQMSRWISYESEGRTPGFKPRWNWFRDLFARWKKLGMIETEKCRRGVIVTIKNYDFYQARRSTDYPGQDRSDTSSQRRSEITRESNDVGDIPPAVHPTTSITIDATTSIRPKNDQKSGKNKRQRGSDTSRQRRSENERDDNDLGKIDEPVAPTTSIRNEPTTGIRKADQKIEASPEIGTINIVNDVNGLVDQSKVDRSQVSDNDPESLPKKKSNQKTTHIISIIENKEVKLETTTEEVMRARAEIPEAENAGNLPAVIEPTILTPVEPVRSKKSPAPVDEILEIFLSTCPDLPRARMTKNLRDQITARWNEDAEYRSLDFWRGYFREWVATSDFLNGESSSGFRASIHWLTGPKNMAKVLAGNYVNRVCKAPMPKTISDCRYLEKKKLEAYEREVLARNRRRDEQREREDRGEAQFLIEKGVQYGKESREDGSRHD